MVSVVRMRQNGRVRLLRSRGQRACARSTSLRPAIKVAGCGRGCELRVTFCGPFHPMNYSYADSNYCHHFLERSGATRAEATAFRARSRTLVQVLRGLGRMVRRYYSVKGRGRLEQGPAHVLLESAPCVSKGGLCSGAVTKY